MECFLALKDPTARGRTVRDPESTNTQCLIDNSSPKGLPTSLHDLGGFHQRLTPPHASFKTLDAPPQLIVSAIKESKATRKKAFADAHTPTRTSMPDETTRCCNLLSGDSHPNAIIHCLEARNEGTHLGGSWMQYLFQLLNLHPGVHGGQPLASTRRSPTTEGWSAGNAAAPALAGSESCREQCCAPTPNQRKWAAHT